jgi:hypothetical protein
MGSSFPRVGDDVDAGEKGDRKMFKGSSKLFFLADPDYAMLCIPTGHFGTAADWQGGGTGRGMKSTTIYLQTAVTATVIDPCIKCCYSFVLISCHSFARWGCHSSLNLEVFMVLTRTAFL